MWFCADPHLNHEHMLDIDSDTGKPYREFKSVNEMNETIIRNINALVGKKDKFYLCGDVLFQKAKSEHLLAELNGDKRLVLGNHDELNKTNLYYFKYFKRITLWQSFREYDFTCTHVPLREDQFRKWSFNVHGHVHKRPFSTPKHINICMEMRDYKPVHLDTLLAEMSELRYQMKHDDKKSLYNPLDHKI